MRIIPGSSAAVMIDVQVRLLPHIHEHEYLLRNTLKLIRGLNILGIPVIVTQQYTKGLGPTAEQLAESVLGFDPIEKITFSCCGERTFSERLSATGRKQVIISGIETHVCVLQTCLDLLESGYLPVVVEDCVSSRRLSDKTTAIKRMRQEGARITTLESILFELTQKAGNEVFKSISGLVK